MAAYKIYAAEISYLGPVGIVINTAYSNAGGYPRAESFVILPDDTVFCHRLSFDVKSFPDTPIALDDDFMLEQALAQAKVDLSSHLKQTAEGKALLDLSQGPNLRESNVNLLVHTWIRGTGGQALKEIYGKSEYEPLREILRPILDLPEILQQPQLSTKRL